MAGVVQRAEPRSQLVDDRRDAGLSPASSLSVTVHEER